MFMMTASYDLRDLQARIGRDEKLRAALLRREFLLRCDLVARDADHGRAERLVLSDVIGEIVRFRRAARGERFRKEIQHDRTASRAPPQENVDTAPPCAACAVNAGARAASGELRERPARPAQRERGAGA